MFHECKYLPMLFTPQEQNALSDLTALPQAKVPHHLNAGYVKIHTLLMTNRSPRRRRPTSTIFLAIYRPTHPPFACQACKWANRQNGTG